MEELPSVGRPDFSWCLDEQMKSLRAALLLSHEMELAEARKEAQRTQRPQGGLLQRNSPIREKHSGDSDPGLPETTAHQINGPVVDKQSTRFLGGDNDIPDPGETDETVATVKQVNWLVLEDSSTQELQKSYNAEKQQLAELNPQEFSVEEKWQAFSWCLLEIRLEDSQDNDEEPVVDMEVQMSIYPDWTAKSANEDSKTDAVDRLRSLKTARSVSVKALRGSSRMSSSQPNQVLQSNGVIQYFVISPSSDRRILWMLAGVLFLTIDLLVIPLNLFVLGSPADDMLETFSYCSFSYWLCDLIIQFFSGYEIPGNGNVEMRLHVIARAYLLSRFFALDFLLILTDIVLFWMGSIQIDAVQSVRILRSIRLMRFLRLLRVGKLKRILGFISQRFTDIYLLTALKVASGLAMIMVVNHFIACAFIWLAELEPNGRNWLHRLGLENDGFGTIYTYALHWSLTQFMPATNNIAPDNAMERVFAVWVIVLAMGVFSSFISGITNAVTSMRAVTEAARKEGSLIRQFFNQRSLSTKLFTKIADYHCLNGTFQVRIQESAVKSLRELPDKIKEQLHEEVYSDILRTAVWFQLNGITSLDPTFFAQVCHLAISEHVAIPSGEAFVADTECAGALTITSGCWVYTYKEEHEEVAVSSWLCEWSLWGPWIHRGRLVSEASSTYCTVDGRRFSKLSYDRGGVIHRYLRTVGLLLAGEIERLSCNQIVTTDMPLEDEVMDGLARRALAFVQLRSPEQFPLARRTARIQAMSPWASKE